MVSMNQIENAMAFYDTQLAETKRLGLKDIIFGFIVSTGIMAATTFGLLYMGLLLEWRSLTIETLLPYTISLVGAAFGSSIIALIICFIIIKYPKTIALPLKIHSFLKHGSGEYFLCPEAKDQNLRRVFRRALYGSILVVGIALTVISFDMLVVSDPEGIKAFGQDVTTASLFILPFVVMQFYFAPWLIKDSGLFHLDIRDRSLSNVGDDLEDVLEFVAGLDLFLVWLELALNSAQSGFQYLWIPLIVIIVALGPLFSIMINWTLVFMLLKNKANLSLIRYILANYRVPEMVESSDYIRKRILGLVDRRMLVEEAVEEFESRKEELSNADLMSTMMEGMVEIHEQQVDTELSTSELLQIIKKRRAELEKSYEVPEETSVTSLKTVGTKEKSDVPENQ
jgi:hypothetical protein